MNLVCDNISYLCSGPLTRIDMAYFMHLALWPPKSNLTPNSEKLCDVTVECGEGLECKVRQMVNTKKFRTSKSTFCLLNISTNIINDILSYYYRHFLHVFNITLQRRCWQVCPGYALRILHSRLISPGVQVNLPHTEDVVKSINILGAPSVWRGPD
jgi:hypothetical protein